MKPAPFELARPCSLPEALRLLADQTRIVRPLAGGQSLVPMLNLRLAPVDLIVDLSAVGELRAVEETAEAVHLGACVTHAEIEDGKVPDPSRGLMPAVAASIAYRAVRNRGTIGGSLALADPSADWPVAMIALDAGIDIERSAGAAYQVPAHRFMNGAYSTVLGDAELLRGVRIPRLSMQARHAFVKSRRKVGEFSHSTAIAVFDPERELSRVVIGATGGAPLWLESSSQLMSELAAGARRGAAAAGPFDPTPVRQAVASDLARQGPSLDDFERSLHGVNAIKAILQVIA